MCFSIDVTLPIELSLGNLLHPLPGSCNRYKSPLNYIYFILAHSFSQHWLSYDPYVRDDPGLNVFVFTYDINQQLLDQFHKTMKTMKSQFNIVIDSLRQFNSEAKQKSKVFEPWYRYHHPVENINWLTGYISRTFPQDKNIILGKPSKL